MKKLWYMVIVGIWVLKRGKMPFASISKENKSAAKSTTVILKANELPHAPKCRSNLGIVLFGNSAAL